MKDLNKKRTIIFGLLILALATACSGTQNSDNGSLNTSEDVIQEIDLSEKIELEDGDVYFSKFDSLADWTFITNNSGEVQYEPEVVYDGLKIELFEANDWVHGYLDFLISDSYMEVEVTHTDGVVPSIELYCRSNEAGEYGFFLDTAGYWEIGLFDFYNTQYTSLGAGISDFINPLGENNIFTAICFEDYFTFLVNGEILGEVRDTTFINGIVGLGVQTWDDDFTEVIFHNFYVRATSLEE